MADQQQPLWEAMYDAYWDGSDEEAHQPGTDAYEQSLRSGFAAEIEALAQWLVPEEPEPEGSEDSFLEYRDGFRWGEWEARQELRQRLLDEARRAREGQA